MKLFLCIFLFGAYCCGADLADVQINVCDRFNVVTSELNLEGMDKKERTLYLLDTHDLQFFNSNLILRLRETKKKTEFTVKIYYLSQDKFDDMKSRNFECEFDAHGTSLSRTCAAKVDVEPRILQQILKNPEQLRNVLSSEQLELLDTKVNWGQDFGRLQVGGPSKELVWELDPAHGASDLTVNYSQSPSQREYFQISSRIDISQWTEHQEYLLKWLEIHGVRLCADQDRQRLEKLKDLLGIN